ncbi:MAG: transposase [Acidimicrobiaceae bacterium]|nr:transposase [Acidimicrobiaceae bacterium]
MEKKKAPRPRRSFTKEFKADAVSLVLDEGRTLADVARSLDIGDGNLGNWVRQARIDRGERDGLTTNEKAELAELRRENSRLRMERDLLKRATAFWVNESQQ